MVKILREPLAQLVIKPTIDWQKYASFLSTHYGMTSELGIDLDEKSKDHAQRYPGDAIPMVCAKSCYKAWGVGRREIDKYLTHILESGHGSVLEHAVFGVVVVTTRAITHEIVRHRAGFAFSQESQRYCDEKNNAFIMPLSIQGNEAAERVWVRQMEEAVESYVQLVESLAKELANRPEFSTLTTTDIRKKVREAARGVLPNDTASIIHLTANVRAWRHFIEMRASQHAEAGIRIVANKILDILSAESPILFGDYKKLPLPDGTFEVQTAYSKV